MNFVRSASVFCLAIVIGLLSGCRNEPQSPPLPPVVKTMRVVMESEEVERTYTGVVCARHEVAEAFRVGGRIEKRLVDVGDRVQEGQVLATLDDKDLRLSLESAQAELKAATSNRDQAVMDESRYDKLLAKHVVSQSEYDLKHLAADEARARFDKAQRSLSLAKNQFDYATLTASTAGVVTKVFAEPGQVVSLGQAVVTVACRGELEVRVDIPESRLADTTCAMAEISLWSNPEVRYRAVLREVSPAADATTRTYAARFSLPDADARLSLGMTATLHLDHEATAPVARIPASALFDQGQGPGVWVVDPGSSRVSLRPVTVKRYTDREVLVRGRLADGEIIVTSGVHMLDENLAVRLADVQPGEGR